MNQRPFLISFIFTPSSSEQEIRQVIQKIKNSLSKEKHFSLFLYQPCGESKELIFDDQIDDENLYKSIVELLQKGNQLIGHGKEVDFEKDDPCPNPKGLLIDQREDIYMDSSQTTTQDFVLENEQQELEDILNSTQLIHENAEMAELRKKSQRDFMKIYKILRTKKIFNERYQNLQFKAMGGFGVVMTSVLKHNGSKVALKMMPNNEDTQVEIKLMLQHIDRCKNLLLPNLMHITKKYNFFISENSKNQKQQQQPKQDSNSAAAAADYVMIEMDQAEYSLKEEIDRRWQSGTPFTFLEIKKIVSDICTSVFLLHINGFAHMDIKPSNILYIKNIESYVLADFGSALQIPTLDFEDAKIKIDDMKPFTPLYSAPQLGLIVKLLKLEQQQSQKIDTSQTFNPYKYDVYSVGVMFLELLVAGTGFFKNKKEFEQAVLHLDKHQEEELLKQQQQYFQDNDQNDQSSHQQQQQLVTLTTEEDEMLSTDPQNIGGYGHGNNLNYNQFKGDDEDHNYGKSTTMQKLLQKLYFNMNGEAALTDLENGQVVTANNHLAMFLQFSEKRRANILEIAVALSLKVLLQSTLPPPRPLIKFDEQKAIYAKGLVYEGGINKNQREGQGVLRTEDGCLIYDGQWQRNAPHGKGVLYIPYLKQGQGENENLCIEGQFTQGIIKQGRAYFIDKDGKKKDAIRTKKKKSMPIGQYLLKESETAIIFNDKFYNKDNVFNLDQMQQEFSTFYIMREGNCTASRQRHFGNGGGIGGGSNNTGGGNSISLHSYSPNNSASKSQHQMQYSQVPQNQQESNTNNNINFGGINKAITTPPPLLDYYQQQFYPVTNSNSQTNINFLNLVSRVLISVNPSTLMVRSTLVEVKEVQFTIITENGELIKRKWELVNITDKDLMVKLRAMCFQNAACFGPNAELILDKYRVSDSEPENCVLEIVRKNLFELWQEVSFERVKLTETLLNLLSQNTFLQQYPYRVKFPSPRYSKEVQWWQQSMQNQIQQIQQQQLQGGNLTSATMTIAMYGGSFKDNKIQPISPFPGINFQSDGDLSDITLIALVKSPVFTSYKKLDLSGCRNITSESIRQMANSLHSENLEEISFEDSELKDISTCMNVLANSRYLKSLQILNLRGCKALRLEDVEIVITSRKLLRLNNLLLENTSLAPLEATLNAFLAAAGAGGREAYNNNLGLNNNFNENGSSGLHQQILLNQQFMLSQFFKGNENIPNKALGLICNNFRLARLIELDLQLNRKNGAWILEELANSSEYVGNVRSIVASQNPVIVDKTLNALVGQSGFMRSIQILFLDGCRGFSDEAVAMIPLSPNFVNLISLNLQNTNTGNQFLKSICQASQKSNQILSQITYLNLAGTQVTEESIVKVIPCLAESLEELVLNQTDVGDKCIAALAQSQNLKHLRTLLLGNCHKITSDGVFELAKNSCTLESLSVLDLSSAVADERSIKGFCQKQQFTNLLSSTHDNINYQKDEDCLQSSSLDLITKKKRYVQPQLSIHTVKLESNSGLEQLIQGKFIRDVVEVQIKNLTDENLLQVLLVEAQHVNNSLKKLQVEMASSYITEKVLEILDQQKNIEREVIAKGCKKITTHGLVILCNSNTFIDIEELHCGNDIQNNAIQLLSQAESRFNLKCIDISLCSQVTDEGLQQLAASTHLQSFAELRAGATSCSGYTLQLLARRAPTFKKVTIQNFLALDDSAATVLLEGKIEVSVLQQESDNSMKFSAKNLKIQDNLTLRCIAECRHFSKLAQIYSDSQQITNEGVMHISNSKQLNNLQEIVLTRTTLNESTLRAFIQSRQNGIQLTKLQIFGLVFQEDNNNYSIAANDLLAQLAHLHSAGCTISLKQLKLRNIDANVFKQVAAANILESIEELHITAGDGLDEESVGVVIAQQMRCLTSLLLNASNLRLHENHFIALHSNSVITVKEVTLHSLYGLSDQGVQMLVQAGQKQYLKGLIALHFQKNLTDQSLKDLSESQIIQTVTEYDGSSCNQISDEGLSKVSQAVRFLSSQLKVVNFAEAEVTVNTINNFVVNFSGSLQLLQFKRLNQEGKAVIKNLDNVLALQQKFVKLKEPISALMIKQLELSSRFPKGNQGGSYNIDSINQLILHNDLFNDIEKLQIDESKDFSDDMIAEIIQKNSIRLNELSLEDTQAAENTVCVIFSAVRFSKLRKLSVVFDFEKAKDICNLLKSLEKLQKFHLTIKMDKYKEGDDVIKDIMLNLKELIKKAKDLEDVGIGFTRWKEGCQKGAEEISQLIGEISNQQNKIKCFKLDLSEWNKGSEQALKAITTSIDHLMQTKGQQLEAIDFNFSKWRNVSDKGVQLISNCLQNYKSFNKMNSITLNLYSWHQSTDEASKYIGNTFSEIKSCGINQLKVLDIRLGDWKNCSEEGAKAISKGLLDLCQANSQIKVLRLGLNNWVQKAQQEFGKLEQELISILPKAKKVIQLQK